MTPTRHSPAVALLLAVLAAGRRGAEAGGDKSDCSVAQTAFSECTGYVAGLDDEVPPQCCQGLGDVKDMAPGADQRRDLCACILSEMLAAGKVDSGRAAGLPSASGSSRPAPILTAPRSPEQIGKSVYVWPTGDQRAPIRRSTDLPLGRFVLLLLLSSNRSWQNYFLLLENTSKLYQLWI
ncbi:hypothetical protein ZWY2020_050638 [Hordeum vulgare]|nr:hypothetical protein ZWY2020_050638 [Hordeum vulgare]